MINLIFGFSNFKKITASERKTIIDNAVQKLSKKNFKSKRKKSNYKIIDSGHSITISSKFDFDSLDLIHDGWRLTGRNYSFTKKFVAFISNKQTLEVIEFLSQYLELKEWGIFVAGGLYRDNRTSIYLYTKKAHVMFAMIANEYDFEASI